MDRFARSARRSAFSGGGRFLAAGEALAAGQGCDGWPLHQAGHLVTGETANSKGSRMTSVRVIQPTLTRSVSRSVPWLPPGP
jgi:hypothetical protein